MARIQVDIETSPDVRETARADEDRPRRKVVILAREGKTAGNGRARAATDREDPLAAIAGKYSGPEWETFRAELECDRD
jgi:hypothetical protein